jgi:hypothetical protein
VHITLIEAAPLRQVTSDRTQFTAGGLTLFFDKETAKQWAEVLAHYAGEDD